MMKPATWKSASLESGILREPVPNDDRLIVWVPSESGAGLTEWERISSSSHSETVSQNGLWTLPASSIRGVQKATGFFRRLWNPFQKSAGDSSWVLPTGEPVEQIGERQTDLLLVWTTDQTDSLNESQLRAQWPNCKQLIKIGKNLFVLYGVQSSPPVKTTQPSPLEGNPRETAEQLLLAARQTGDRVREASALADLGLALLYDGDAPRASAVLEQALSLSREMGDAAGERDAIGNLGMALLAARQPDRALTLFQQELVLARTSGDRFTEKTAWYHHGLAYSSLGDLSQAERCITEALKLAQDLGDYQNEAELYWYLAILFAEQGLRQPALENGKAAIQILQRHGKPQADIFVEHLQKYLASAASNELGHLHPGNPGVFQSGTIVAGMGVAQPTPAQSAASPSVLHMALSAVKSMAKYLRSGLKRVPPSVYQKRLQTCGNCAYHTGIRCKVCGCFTSVKAWLPHEDCPAGKWPKV